MPNLKAVLLFLTACLFMSFQPNGEGTSGDPSSYLDDNKSELKKKWPGNRTINLVFHGHSVPTGYFKTSCVNTLDSHPFLLLKELKEIYPYAVLNVICTAIGSALSASFVCLMLESTGSYLLMFMVVASIYLVNWLILKIFIKEKKTITV